MSRKLNQTNNILKLLSNKSAVPLERIKETTDKKDLYTINRSIKSLIESGCVEKLRSDNKEYLRLTKKGKSKSHSLCITNTDSLVSQNWDGFWRIIILDLPEERKSERESLRYLLKKAGFVCVKNTVWISPHPFEQLFMNIKKDLDLTTEIMIIVTKFIDEETRAIFLKNFLRE